MTTPTPRFVPALFMTGAALWLSACDAGYQLTLLSVVDDDVDSIALSSSGATAHMVIGDRTRVFDVNGRAMSDGLDLPAENLRITDSWEEASLVVSDTEVFVVDPGSRILDRFPVGGHAIAGRLYSGLGASWIAESEDGCALVHGADQSAETQSIADTACVDVTDFAVERGGRRQWLASGGILWDYRRAGGGSTAEPADRVHYDERMGRLIVANGEHMGSDNRRPFEAELGGDVTGIAELMDDETYAVSVDNERIVTLRPEIEGGFDPIVPLFGRPHRDFKLSRTGDILAVVLDASVEFYEVEPPVGELVVE